MAQKLVLLSSWFSVFGNRVRIALAEKGVEYDLKEEDVWNKSQLLLQSNPIYKKVPVLIHDGKPLCESAIIVQYIDEVWSNNTLLLPQDPYERSKARFWVDFIGKKIYDSGARIVRGKGEVQVETMVELIGYLKLLEGELGEKQYFGGNAFGYVDIGLIPFYASFYTYETFGKLSIEEECPKLMAWVRRCMERESVSKVLPDPHKVFEFYCDFRKRMGIE